MTSGRYILRGQLPVEEPDLLVWADWFERASRTHSRQVADIMIEGIRISTVFLSIDHQFEDGPPVLFETMIFDQRPNRDPPLASHLADHCARYATWLEASIGHDLAVTLVRAWLAEIRT